MDTVTIERKGERWAVVVRHGDTYTRVAVYTARYKADQHAARLRGDGEVTA